MADCSGFLVFVEIDWGGEPSKDVSLLQGLHKCNITLWAHKGEQPWQQQHRGIFNIILLNLFLLSLFLLPLFLLFSFYWFGVFLLSFLGLVFVF
jgi:hypothetical protein